MNNAFDRRLVGKIIKSAVHMKDINFIDEPYLKLEFTDGTECLIRAYHIGEHSPFAEDEYPVRIDAVDVRSNLVPVAG